MVDSIVMICNISSSIQDIIIVIVIVIVIVVVIVIVIVVVVVVVVVVVQKKLQIFIVTKSFSKTTPSRQHTAD